MTEFRKGIGNLVTSLKGLDFLHRDDVVSSWSSTTTDDNLPTEKLVKDTIDSTNSSVSGLSSQMSSVQAFVNNATTDKVYDMSTLSNLNTTPHTSQQAINSAIDTALGDIVADIVADEDLSVKIGSEKAFVVTSMTTKGKNMLYNINLSVNDYQTVGTLFVKVPSYTQGTNYSIAIVCKGMEGGSIPVYDGSVQLSEIGANGYILKLSYDSSSGRYSLIEKYSVDKLLPYFSDLSTVATTGSYNDLGDKPSIPTVPSSLSSFTNDTGFITSSDVPSASSTTPSADTTSGSVGDGTTWARSNHTHPKSDLYAEASHTHLVEDLSNITVVKCYLNTDGKVYSDSEFTEEITSSNNIAFYNIYGNNNNSILCISIKWLNGSKFETDIDIGSNLLIGGFLLPITSLLWLMKGIAFDNSTHLIKNASALKVIGTSANDSQMTINSYIDSKLGNLENSIGDAITIINGNGGE